MHKSLDKLNMIILSLKKAQLSMLLKELRRRFYATEYSYGLKRDLTLPFLAHDAKIPIRIRPLEQTDVPELLDLQDKSSSLATTKERMRRSLFLSAKIPTCYVAVTDSGAPCYMQWLIGSEHNDELQSYFDHAFPKLKKNEMLLEFAYTKEAFRGQGVMSKAMALIAEEAKTKGARAVITFVNQGNIASLKGCERAGFLPYIVREDKWRFFRRSVAFIALSERGLGHFEPKLVS